MGFGRATSRPGFQLVALPAIIPITAAPGDGQCFPRPARPATALMTPWPRASSPRWRASSSTGARFRPGPKRAWRSSNSWKAGTTHAVVIPPGAPSVPTTSNAPGQRQRPVGRATVLDRLEGSPVLAGAASRTTRTTLRGVLSLVHGEDVASTGHRPLQGGGRQPSTVDENGVTPT